MFFFCCCCLEPHKKLKIQSLLPILVSGKWVVLQSHLIDILYTPKIASSWRGDVKASCDRDLLNILAELQRYSGLLSIAHLSNLVSIFLLF